VRLFAGPTGRGTLSTTIRRGEAMNEPAETVTLTWHHLRTLLESARAGDSVEEAMLQAEQWDETEDDDG